MQVGSCEHKHIIKLPSLCVLVLKKESERQRDGVKDRMSEGEKEEKEVRGG